MTTLPAWLQRLLAENSGQEDGLGWHSSEEIESFGTYTPPAAAGVAPQQQPAAEQWVRVGAGPPRVDRAGNEHPSQLWFNVQQPEQLRMALIDDCPSFLWIPAGSDMAGIRRTLDAYFFQEVPPQESLHRQFRAYLGSEDELGIDFEELENQFTLNRFCEILSWGSAFPTDPYPDHYSPFGANLLVASRFMRQRPDSVPCTSFRTVHSRSVLGIQDYGGGFIVTAHYRPAREADVIRAFNQRFASAYPEDIPVDIVAALLDFAPLTSDQLELRLAGVDQDTRMIASGFSLLALLRNLDEDHLVDMVRGYTLHPSPPVRRAAALMLYTSARRDALEEVRARESDAETREYIDGLLRILEASERRDQLSAEDLYRSAQDRRRIGETDQAIEELTQAIALNPRYLEAYLDRGTLFLGQQEDEKAAADFDQVLALNPENVAACYNLGIASYYMEEPEEAIEHYSEALKLQPDHVAAYLNRGNAYREIGDKAAAIEDYTSVLRLEPTAADAYRNRGWTRADLQDDQGALEDLTAALRQDEQFAAAFYDRAHIRARLGEKAGAAEDFQRAAQLFFAQGNRELAQDAQRLAALQRLTATLTLVGTSDGQYGGGVRSSLRCVAWSPDGTMLASGGYNGTVRIWDAATGRALNTYTGHEYQVLTLAWSPDSTMIASAGGYQGIFAPRKGFDSTIHIWNVRTLERLLVFESQNHQDTAKQIWSVAWSPDGRFLASASHDQTVQIWEAASGEVRTVCRHPEGVNWVAWSPDGTRIATGGNDALARVWDAATGETLLEHRGHAALIETLAWSRDGRKIVSGGYTREEAERLEKNEPKTKDQAAEKKRHIVHVWDADTGDVLVDYPGFSDSVVSVAWSPDGQSIAAAGEDKTVQVWSAENEEPRFSHAIQPDVDKPLALSWSPDCRQIAVGTDEGYLQIWDALDGQYRYLLGHYSNEARVVAWAPDGTRVAVSTGNGRYDCIRSGMPPPLAIVWSIMATTTRRSAWPGPLMANISLRRRVKAARMSGMPAAARPW
jgi:WD40 repeat protein/tetratricopeptide (TPR) repeat protein